MARFRFNQIKKLGKGFSLPIPAQELDIHSQILGFGYVLDLDDFPQVYSLPFFPPMVIFKNLSKIVLGDLPVDLFGAEIAYMPGLCHDEGIVFLRKSFQQSS